MNWIYKSLLNIWHTSSLLQCQNDKHYIIKFNPTSMYDMKIFRRKFFSAFKTFLYLSLNLYWLLSMNTFFIKMCLWAKKELKTLTSVAFSKKVNSTDEAEQYGKRCSSYCTVKESQMPNHLRKLQSNKVQWEKVFSLRNLTFHTFNLC